MVNDIKVDTTDQYR